MLLAEHVLRYCRNRRMLSASTISSLMSMSHATAMKVVLDFDRTLTKLDTTEPLAMCASQRKMMMVMVMVMVNE